MTRRSCWVTSGGRRYRRHKSGNKNRQYPVRVGLSLRKTAPGVGSSHDRKSWEVMWSRLGKRPPQGAGLGSEQVSKIYTKNEPVAGRNIFHRA